MTDILLPAKLECPLHGMQSRTGTAINFGGASVPPNMLSYDLACGCNVPYSTEVDGLNFVAVFSKGAPNSTEFFAYPNREAKP